MRRADPYIIAFGVYLMLAASAVSAADAAVSLESVKAFVYETLAVGGVVIIGAAGGLIAWVLARDRELQGKRFERIEIGLNEMLGRLHQAIRALTDHNECTTAHTIAAEHNHQPMNDKISEIADKLDHLILEHRVIRGSEDEVCAMIRSLRTRDPKDSPKPKRDEDPEGFDGRTLRGKP